MPYHPETTGTAKLTWEQVREIRARFAAGEVVKYKLGQEYSITPRMVYLIVTGKSWFDKKYCPPNHMLQDARFSLNQSMADEIRTKSAQDGITGRQLAKEYGVTEMTISQVLSGKIWKN